MRGVIFDLDGTLVDSLGDIAAAMNRSLAARNFPTHPLDAYRAFVGEGVRKLAERALPADALSETTSLVAAYQADYAQHFLESSAPYPGVPELLEALSSRGVPMSVLSNKPDAPTRQLVEALFGGWRFRAVSGERPGVPRKPDPTAALELARDMDVPATHVSFIGDTLVDVACARAAGMRPLGVLWGFRAQEVADSGVTTVRRPEELLPLLTR
jgi:phosphoglycolate phosphatase